MHKRRGMNPYNIDIKRLQSGKIGYGLLWLVGVPIPILLGIFFLRGCN